MEPFYFADACCVGIFIYIATYWTSYLRSSIGNTFCLRDMDPQHFGQWHTSYCYGFFWIVGWFIDASLVLLVLKSTL